MTPILPLFATAYLPPIAYVATLMHYETIAIEACETYPKQTYRNRCSILTANGLLHLAIPVTRPQGNHTIISEAEISYAEPWNVRHWRAIESAYSASPYFLYYRDGIESILLKKHNRLIDLNTELTTHILKKLKIPTHLKFTPDYVKPTDTLPYSDFRQSFSPKNPSNPAIFQPYNQVFSHKYPFCPNLTILDLLFNLGPEANQYLKCSVNLSIYDKTNSPNNL
ncbi:MAG: WbqC family protein [Bacteroidales bacterium]|nr:WbqC family protein [Bacteroidales bacterium]